MSARICGPCSRGQHAPCDGPNEYWGDCTCDCRGGTVNIPDEQRDQIKRVYNRAYDQAFIANWGGAGCIEAGVMAAALWARRLALLDAHALCTTTTDAAAISRLIEAERHTDERPHDSNTINPWKPNPKGTPHA